MANDYQIVISPTPRRLAVQSILGFWVFYFALNSVCAAMWDGPDQLDMLGRRTVVALFGIVLTGLLYLVLRIIDAAVSWYLFIVAWGVLWVARCAERVREAERQAACYQAESTSRGTSRAPIRDQPTFSVQYDTLSRSAALFDIGTRLCRKTQCQLRLAGN